MLCQNIQAYLQKKNAGKHCDGGDSRFFVEAVAIVYYYHHPAPPKGCLLEAFEYIKRIIKPVVVAVRTKEQLTGALLWSPEIFHTLLPHLVDPTVFCRIGLNPKEIANM